MALSTRETGECGDAEPNKRPGCHENPLRGLGGKTSRLCLYRGNCRSRKPFYFGGAPQGTFQVLPGSIEATTIGQLSAIFV
ncbi:hypothetical protein CSUI_004863 [Cystoisospora suis]|uniref:Uncharacterized protein n=1 Tax=Cystoisospora suis TaxID=483139 RepID=A0A2C6KX80_9APIC|nr:hypothetical protein CSUI_004863 [Cystoisospora suis]